MIAKFDSRCPACKQVIAAGSTIVKSTDGRYVHVICAQTSGATTTTAAPAKRDEYREISARFDSVCVKCGGAIALGERIMWKPKSKAFHVACGEQDNSKLDMSNGMLPGAPDSYDRGPFEGPVGDGQVQVRSQKARYERNATREEQHERYIDCGPNAWDDRDPEPDDFEF